MLRKLLRLAYRLFIKTVECVSLPIILREYLEPQTGREYGVGLLAKLALACKIARNVNRIWGASSYLEHLMMATQILKTPKSVPGCVVECGSFKGRSAANLSLVCALCGRRLEIFDSFAGLPEPSESDSEHKLLDSREIHTYSKGAWCGTLEEVKRNISKYGKIEVCGMNVGYFEQTLPAFRERCILVFIDVDLRASLRTCLQYLWPLLRERCYLFTHEAQHEEISSQFFDQEWWHAKVGCPAPGLIGAGNGLGLSPASGGFVSHLGYTVKQPFLPRFTVRAEAGSTYSRKDITH
jgi:O-methyltransferase